MSRYFFISLFFFNSFLFADNTNKWAYQHTFELKKDELAKVHFWLSDNNDDDNAGKNRETYYFRWTLYDGKNIVVHSNYRKFPKQHIMSKNRALSTVNQVLISDGKNKIDSRVVLSLIFSDYNHSKKSASFDILIKDDKKRVLAEFDDPKRRRELSAK